jgi:type IV secretory pathway protease TraF
MYLLLCCIETDGLGQTIWRFAHNRAVWNPEFYGSQPYGNISLDGRFFSFSSSWDEQVGT